MERLSLYWDRSLEHILRDGSDENSLYHVAISLTGVLFQMCHFGDNISWQKYISMEHIMSLG